MESIGSRIVACRKELGLKAKELARRVGCHPPDISDWENGKTRPSVESLCKLARALNTTETWLLSGLRLDLPNQQEAEADKIRKFPVDKSVLETDNVPLDQWEKEMLKDKEYIIQLQKEKIQELEERIATLEGRKPGKSAKKPAG